MSDDVGGLFVTALADLGGATGVSDSLAFFPLDEAVGDMKEDELRREEGFPFSVDRGVVLRGRSCDIGVVLLGRSSDIGVVLLGRSCDIGVVLLGRS